VADTKALTLAGLEKRGRRDARTPGRGSGTFEVQLRRGAQPQVSRNGSR